MSVILCMYEESVIGLLKVPKNSETLLWNLLFVSFKNGLKSFFCMLHFDKIHIFWECHKIWQNLHTFLNFGLLKIYGLYLRDCQQNLPENHNCYRFYFLGIPDWFHLEIIRLLYVNLNLSRTLATYFWLEYVWIEAPLKRHFLTHNTVALFIITSLHQHFPFALCKHIMKLLYI